jgi:hypothetical protein
METKSAPMKTDVRHLEHSDPHDENVDIDEKIEVIQVQAAAEHLNVIDFELLSRESIQFKSRATLRLIVVIIIQGISELQPPPTLLGGSSLLSSLLVCHYLTVTSQACQHSESTTASYLVWLRFLSSERILASQTPKMVPSGASLSPQFTSAISSLVPSSGFRM